MSHLTDTRDYLNERTQKLGFWKLSWLGAVLRLIILGFWACGVG